MKFPMIHTDKQGETHFGVTDIQDREFAVGPPPNHMGQMSDLGAVITMYAISFPAGTEAPAHPQRPFALHRHRPVRRERCCDQRWRSAAIPSREVLFCNDLIGKGHVTRALSDMIFAFVNRAKS